MPNAFDAINAPEGEPESIVVGDFVQWKRSDIIADYPAALYTATYVARITGGGHDEIQVVGSGEATHYLFAISGASSTVFAPGYYFYQLEIKRNSDNERIVIYKGGFTVTPDLDANNADPRTNSKIMLDKIESLLNGKADSDVSSYSVAGRSLTKMTFAELQDSRNFYKQEVLREQAKADIKNGVKGHTTIQVRF
tara:strand:+ start:1332 stop:1916 length:585 start_codon:yes stop_codon:yes gene_type:complete